MSHFFAYLSRMKLIDRWGLMRSLQRENVQEHSLQVAVIAHGLAVIKNKFFNGKVDPSRVALQAIYHDASEVITGDLPTPVKYFSREIKDAYQSIERYASEQLLNLLPQELRGEYHELLMIPDAEKENKTLIKAADSICAYLKCLEERAAGNHEFARAQRTIEEKLIAYQEPEVQYFLKHFVPSFSLTLDEMSEPFFHPEKTT